MPTLIDFGGWKIKVYFNDHNPPHVHVIGPDFDVQVEIETGIEINGTIDPKFRKKALQWIKTHKAAILLKWNEGQ